jgi:regulator of RNase E activity RraA
MDKMGLYHQILPPYLRPLRDDMVVVGRAMPVLEADVFAERFTGNHALSEKPFGLMFHALDDLKPGEVYVAAGASHNYALWGELMSTRAMQLGCAGAVVDGYSRDTPGVLGLNFPTFSKGRYCQDQGARGKVIDWRVPIEIAGIRIQPGMLIFGDIDGVIVVPLDREKEIIEAALEKARGETLVAKAIKEGMSAVEAYETFGIM